MPSRRKKAGKVNRELTIGIIVAICLIIVGVLIALIYANRHRIGPSESIGVPQYWKTANNQMTLRTKDITFAIKDIDISHQEFRFFYVEKASKAELFVSVIIPCVPSPPTPRQSDIPPPVLLANSEDLPDPTPACGAAD